MLSARLRNAFAQNLARLGFGAGPAVDVRIGPGSVGQHPYQLTLVARDDVPPSEILSEGERTCVGLAGFLAELTTTNNLSGIVLDDPVSSLDHRYRLHVARCLVEEARQRQVIVLTHDIVFLLMLTQAARSFGVPLKDMTLLRGGNRHGVSEDGPPWVAMPVNRRLGVLKSQLQTAAAVLRQGDRATYEQKAEWILERLRQSWERAVEELLLNQVVVRFGAGVQTQRLKVLSDISEEDVRLVEAEMGFCSSFIHDESGAVNNTIPEPDVVQAAIQKLESWVAALRKRGRN